MLNIIHINSRNRGERLVRDAKREGEDRQTDGQADGQTQAMALMDSVDR